MLQKLIVTILGFILLIGCSSDKKPRELKIATNVWIGYAPLFYAKEKGELDKENIRLIHNVSLAEAADIFSVGKADMVTTTQHEYLDLKKMIKDIKPIILLDRSNGGDMILSNKTVKELIKSKDINIYLEVDSINMELIKHFISVNQIERKYIRFINMDQLKIQEIENNDNKDIVIVTYSPYDLGLKKRGFRVIASTKDINDLLVIDALCVREYVIDSDYARIKRLKKIIDNAIIKIKEDPKDAYRYIAPYLDNISYKDFLDSLKLIKWINNPSKDLIKKIENIGYQERDIIK